LTVIARSNTERIAFHLIVLLGPIEQNHCADLISLFKRRLPYVHPSVCLSRSSILVHRKFGSKVPEMYQTKKNNNGMQPNLKLSKL